jgi:hypothetical protein
MYISDPSVNCNKLVSPLLFLLCVALVNNNHFIKHKRDDSANFSDVIWPHPIKMRILVGISRLKKLGWATLGLNI